jgi:hypothetical protein
MSFTITTVYPDGRTETRDATPEEVAQRDADLVAFEAERIAREAAEAQAAAAKASAIAKLEALGLTADEVSAAFGLQVT